MNVNTSTGHICIFGENLKIQDGHQGNIVVLYPVYNHSCKFPLWAGIHVIISNIYVTFHGIYIVPAEILYHGCQLCTSGPP